MALTEVIKNTKFAKKVGDQVTIFHFETSVAQVKLSDGTSLADKIVTMENLVTGMKNVYVEPNIAGRDALTGLSVGDQCWVIDATADTTVENGGAKYIVETMTDGAPNWVKIAEAESMDVIVKWDDIQNKPATSEQLTAAITDAHTHTNKDVLDAISETEEGKLAFNNNPLNMIEIVDALTDNTPNGLYFVTEE